MATFWTNEGGREGVRAGERERERERARARERDLVWCGCRAAVFDDFLDGRAEHAPLIRI